MAEFVGRTLRCPVCLTEFGIELPVTGEPVAVETDFRPVFEGPDPIAFDVIACPTCRYAGYPEAFHGGRAEEGEELERPGVPPAVGATGVPEERELEDLRRWIRRGELIAGMDLGGREPTAAERYRLAARVRDYLTEKEPLPIADLLVRGAWCARRAGNREQERELLDEAVELLDGALEEGLVPAAELGRTIYLTAELARRMGDFALAVDLFGQVEANVDLDEPEGMRLHRLARRMGALATMKSDVAARMPEDEELDAPELDELRWSSDDDGEES